MKKRAVWTSELDGESNVGAQFNFGAGIEIKIGEDWRIRGEGVYHTMGNSKIDGVDTRDGSEDLVSLAVASLAVILTILGSMQILVFFITSAKANLQSIASFILV